MGDVNFCHLRVTLTEDSPAAAPGEKGVSQDTTVPPPSLCLARVPCEMDIYRFLDMLQDENAHEAKSCAARRDAAFAACGAWKTMVSCFVSVYPHACARAFAFAGSACVCRTDAYARIFSWSSTVGLCRPASSLSSTCRA
ncbi:MAG: hypothetical protein ACPIOQ_53755 [Promethearchaeia archaeon]